jgi:hypothetical protein
MAFPLALLPIIASAAPALIGLITGSPRAEAVSKSVVDVVEAATGVTVSDEASAARAAAALKEDPEAWAAFQREALAIQAAETQALLADRADARARDIEVRRLEGGGNRRADALLWAIVALLVSVLAANVAIGVWVREEGPHLTAAVGLLGTAAGFLLRGLSSALDFEFGSSRGSKEKSAQLDKMLGKPASTSDALSAWREMQR